MLVQCVIASHAEVQSTPADDTRKMVWQSIEKDSKITWDLSVLVGILLGVESDHGTGPRRNGSVNSIACSILWGCERQMFN